MKRMRVSSKWSSVVIAVLFSGMLSLSTNAQSMTEPGQTPDTPAAAQGAQVGPESFLPEAEPVASAVSEAEEVMASPARRLSRNSEKAIAIKVAEPANAVSVPEATAVTPELTTAQQDLRSSGNFATRLLLKKALKKAAKENWGGKNAAGQRKAQATDTLVLLGAILSGLGIILLFVIPIIGLLFILPGNILLFLAAIK